MAELMERTNNIDDTTASLTNIVWMSIRTRLDQYSTMAKCILAPPTNAQHIRQTYCSLSPATLSHLVTADYKAIVIPPITDYNYDKIMSQTITTQFSALESTTMISFQNLGKLDPFTTIPTLTLMESTDPSLPNTRSIATLLRHGRISIEGNIVSSPITKVATDTTGSRLYIYAPKSEVAALISFAEHIHVLLPTWTNSDKPIHLDMTDATRALRASHTVTGPQNVVTIQPAHAIHTEVLAPPPTRNSNTLHQTPRIHFPPPPPHPSQPSITMSIEQYNQILGQFSAVLTRMDRTDSTIDAILSKLTNSPPIVTSTEWADSITSAITTTLSSEADSIRDHQLTTSSTQQTQLMIPLNTHTRDIAAQSKLLKSHIEESATSQAEVSTHMTQTTQLLNTTMSEVTLIRREVLQLMESMTPQTQTHVQSPTIASRPKALTTNDNSSQPPQPQEIITHQLTASADGTHDTSPMDSPVQPHRGDCTACHEYSNELQLCCDCELPFDPQCILAITHRPTNTAEYQCVNCHRKSNPTTQGSSTAGLSEPDEDTNSESSTNTGSSTSQISSEQDESPAPSITRKPNTGAATPGNRSSPPRTRHYTKSIGPDTSDPHHN